MTIQSVLKRATLLLGVMEGAPEVMPSRERLLAALDSALGELSRSFPLQARSKITVENGVGEMPATALIPRALYGDGRRVPFSTDGRSILAEDGRYTLVYYRVPPVASQLEETAELPYPEDLQLALPFYVAALTVMAEDPNLYNRLMEQYNTKVATALGYRPAAGVESGGSL